MDPNTPQPNQPDQGPGPVPQQPSSPPAPTPQQPVGEPLAQPAEPTVQPPMQPAPVISQPVVSEPVTPLPPISPLQPTKKSKAKLITIIVALAVILGGGGAAAYLFLLKGSSGPEQAARQYFESFLTQDCETITKLISNKALGESNETREEFRKACDEIIGSFGDLAKDTEAEVKSTRTVTSTDDTATVELVLSAKDEADETVEIDLIREDGEWRLGSTEF